MEIKDYVKNSLQSKATKSSAVTCKVTGGQVPRHL